MIVTYKTKGRAMKKGDLSITFSGGTHYFNIPNKLVFKIPIIKKYFIRKYINKNRLIYE